MVFLVSEGQLLLLLARLAAIRTLFVQLSPVFIGFLRISFFGFTVL